MENDSVNHPSHYTGGEWAYRAPECIDITRFLSFCTGNAIKYIWRAGLKGDAQEDLDKALWYLSQPKTETGMETAAFSLLHLLQPKEELEKRKWNILSVILDQSKPGWMAETLVSELKSWIRSRKA